MLRSIYTTYYHGLLQNMHQTSHPTNGYSSNVYNNTRKLLFVDYLQRNFFRFLIVDIDI